MRQPSATAQPGPIPRRVTVLVFCICVAGGVALRLWGLGLRSLWVDEALSVLYATIDWAEVIEMRRFGTNPPLYHFLLSAWVGLFGTSAAAIRAMSAIFATASVGVMFILARRLAGRNVALVATSLLAASNLSIAYAQEARFYAMTQLLSLASSLFLFNLIERQRRRDAGAYVACASALVWTHTYGWFVVAAHVVWVLAARRATPFSDHQRRRIGRLGLASISLVVLSFIPWIPILLQQIREVRRGYWISEPGWAALAQTVHGMLVLVRIARWPMVILAGLAVVYWSARLLRARKSSSPASPVDRPVPVPQTVRRCHLWGLIAWMVLPILIPFVWSKLSTPIFQIKYGIVAQAAALILLAVLLTRRPLVWMTVLALLTGIWPPSADRGLIVEDWRAAARVLEEHAAPGATVFVYRDYAYFSLNYHLPDDYRLRPVYSEGQTANCFTPYYHRDAIPFDEMMRSLAESEEDEVWFVLRWGSAPKRQQLRERIAALCDNLTAWELRYVDVLRLVHREPGKPTAGRPPELETRDRHGLQSAGAESRTPMEAAFGQASGTSGTR